MGEVQISGRDLTAPVSGGAGTLTEVLRRLNAEGVNLRDVGLRRPTLDDVFLALTGQITGQGPAVGDTLMEEVA
jgi:ABC-2 type transport system ATP-binding protein